MLPPYTAMDPKEDDFCVSAAARWIRCLPDVHVPMDLLDTHATAPMVLPDAAAPTPKGLWTPVPPPQGLSGTRAVELLPSKGVLSLLPSQIYSLQWIKGLVGLGLGTRDWSKGFGAFDSSGTGVLCW